MFKYADDTIILGLIRNDETCYRTNVELFTKWCDNNHLQLNPSKTKEIIFDFRKARPQYEPVQIKGDNIEIVKKYKYLGTTLDNKLTWIDECAAIVSKARTRMYFLRKLGSLHVDKSILSLFYKSIVESILLFNCVVWFGACRKEDFKKMEAIVKRASKIIGEGRHLEQECKDKILQKTKEILANEGHTLYYFYEFMRSGPRFIN